MVTKLLSYAVSFNVSFLILVVFMLYLVMCRLFCFVFLHPKLGLYCKTCQFINIFLL